MIRWAVMAAAALQVASVQAGPFDGRWAADSTACADETAPAGPLKVTPLSLSWPGAFCAVGTSYLVRDSWHISARCWGEGVVSNVPIRLQLRGDRLLVDWARARLEEMRRCP
jgi:hypothetical protein